MTRRSSLLAGAACLVWMGQLAVSGQTRTPAVAKAAAVPTFTKDVAPILYKNCTSCHRPGEIAPMSLLTYDDARPYAKDMAEKVNADQMPPWHADPSVGHFKNDRRLTPVEKDTLVRWASNGAPRGNAKDMPPAPKYTSGWNIGTPDVVYTMPEEFKVPASGTVEYQYFDIPTNFTEDKWIQSIEVRPGNRAVVHHVIVFYQEPAGSTPRTRAIQMAPNMGKPKPPVDPNAPAPAPPDPNAPKPRVLGMMLGGLAPGTEAVVFPEGVARLMRKGSNITFQMHYTANGTAGTDRTTIGIKFAPKPPDIEVRTTALINQNFVIKAGDANSKIEATMTLLEDVTLWSMLPHTHLRGKSWSYDVTYPDGRNEPLLAVPQYDFNWQTEYWFKEPMRLPKGTKIHAIAHYDNSTGNRSNPDPKQNVEWGDQTWEEMMFTAFSYSVDKDNHTLTLIKPGGGGR